MTGLNPFASVWEPSAVGASLKKLSINKQQNGSAKQGLGGGAAEHANGGSVAAAADGNKAGLNGQAHQHEEMQFDDVMFERPLSQASVNPSTEGDTPRASFVGPSPLPSPAVSPCSKGLSLLALTEDAPTNRKQAVEVQSMAEHTEVITHVETEASAQLASTSGRTKLGPNDFELLRVVGQGAFGKVFQVRKRDTREIFAMKVMRKDRIVERDHKDYVRAERDVLTAVVHPYIVTLRYSFQTPKKLYLVLDFINGGHLFFQLYRQGTFDEPLARLYTAEIVLAIAHLHSLGFVHRDLKPENVLLDGEGHIKVTDFGLAKGNISDSEHQRTNSFIGTMEYMAPEIIEAKGHGKAVDWWSVGVLLYEMLCGVPPFRAKGRNQLQKLIVAAKLKLPPYLSTEAQSLVKGLLNKTPAKRLGYGPTGSADVMKHPFFRSMDWKKLEEREIASPFRPTIRSIESTENFDKIWTDLPVQDSPCPTPRQQSLDEKLFGGWSYNFGGSLAEAAAAEALLLNPMRTIVE